MRIQINGVEATVSDGTTLMELVRARGLSPERIVVEHNRSIVPATQWANAALADGDTLEIVSFVGGG